MGASASASLKAARPARLVTAAAMCADGKERQGGVAVSLFHSRLSPHVLALFLSLSPSPSPCPFQALSDTLAILTVLFAASHCELT